MIAHLFALLAHLGGALADQIGTNTSSDEPFELHLTPGQFVRLRHSVLTSEWSEAERMARPLRELDPIRYRDLAAVVGHIAIYRKKQ